MESPSVPRRSSKLGLRKPGKAAPAEEPPPPSKVRSRGSLTMRRSQHAVSDTDADDEALEASFAAVLPHCHVGLRAEEVPPESKRRLLENFRMVQTLSADDFVKVLVKYKPRVVLRPHDQLGLYGALAERRTDWKEAFVAQGGAKQLAKIMAKMMRLDVADAKAQLALILGDCVRCFVTLMSFESGLEALISGYPKAVATMVDALPLLTDARCVEALTVLSGLVCKSDQGHAVVAGALIRPRSSPIERMVGSIEHAASDDVRVATFILFNTLLTRGALDVRGRVLQTLMALNLSSVLDALTDKPDCDGELRTLIGVLRERTPEFRKRSIKVIAAELSDAFRPSPHAQALLASTLGHLGRLGRDEAVWRLVEGLAKSLAAAPVVNGDVDAWFRGVVSSYGSALTLEADKRALTERVTAMQSTIDGCTRCSVLLHTHGGEVSQNPVVTMRALAAAKHGGEEARGVGHTADTSSEESTEFVDINLDGARTFPSDGGRAEFDIAE